MANEEDSILTNPGSSEMSRHVHDYSRFTALFKWGAIACLVIAFIVLFLIS
jgi:hypothetical protein